MELKGATLLIISCEVRWLNKGQTLTMAVIGEPGSRSDSQCGIYAQSCISYQVWNDRKRVKTFAGNSTVY